METKSNLFSPYMLKSLELKNRMVMAPMTRCRAIDNIPNELMATYYSQRAEAALIISEATAPSPNGLGAARIPGIFSEKQKEAWKKITSAVHSKGSKIFMQVMHTGRVSHHFNMPDGARILAPSPIACEGKIWTDVSGLQSFPEPDEMTKSDIKQAVSEFARAAKLAIQAGFDGVELHAANGYLIHEFLNPASNIRSDEYGFAGITPYTFVIEVLDAVVSEIGKEKVGIHLSPYSQSNGMILFEDFELYYLNLMRAIEKSVLYIHLVMPESDFFKKPEDTFAWQIRNHVSCPLILNNGYDHEKADYAIANNLTDLISFGRSFLSNPDLVTRFRRNLKLNEADRSTFYSIGEKGYTDYPFAET